MNKAVDAAGSVKAEAETEITLGLLSAVGDETRHSQRSLASELGIALGLTNAYLRRCVRKGLIKVSGAPANRYAYYLTPKGFTEKSRLTAKYLSKSLRFFFDALQKSLLLLLFILFVDARTNNIDLSTCL